MSLLFIFMQDVGFHMCGSVRICTTPERLEEAKYQMHRHGWLKAPQRLITTEEVAQVHPLLNVDDVFGALYFPGQWVFILLSSKKCFIITLKTPAAAVERGSLYDGSIRRKPYVNSYS